MPLDTPTSADVMQWDVINWSVALPFWEAHVDWARCHHALEIGGREGGLSLWLAHRGVDVICSDLEDAGTTAAPSHRRFGVEDHVTYQDIDATQIPYENEFDLIVFKSILGGIGRGANSSVQQTVIDQIFKALIPGGILLFAENLTASPAHRYLRRRFVKWGDYWHYVTLPEMSAFFTAYTGVQIRTTGVLGTFGRSENQRRWLGKIDQALVNRIVPSHWRYIAYGVARKPG